jgi:hypothetical protein
VRAQGTHKTHKRTQRTGDNHGISALKFGIIRRFLAMGWAVLLSDIDVAVLQDPFKHLYRCGGGAGGGGVLG